MITTNILRFLAKRRKALRWIVGVLACYAIIGFFILPPIIRAVAVRNLSRQLDRDVSIQKVKLNPFTLSATIRGLLIKDKDGQPFISWDEVYVNFQLASFFGHPWVFKEISTSRPFVRVQMNKNYTLNFSDLIAKFSAKAPTRKPSRPLALRVGRLHIAGAILSLTDMTPRTPFRRLVGPLDITLQNFETAPDNRNPYSFAGTTDAGEKFAWSGFFYLDPLRSQGSFSLDNLSLNKYAPLYQDLVRFQIRDGTVGVHSTYGFELSASNHVAWVTNASFELHSFKLADPANGKEIVELPDLAVSGASLDATARRAEINSVSVTGARLTLERNTNQTINVAELSRPAEGATNAPGGILLLLRAVTNSIAMLLRSTNTWTGAIRDVNVRDCALNLEDFANSRPVHLHLDHITLAATNISNLPGTNLTASLSLRWNTNGSIKTDVTASFQPPTADIQLGLDRLELRPLDPYLESRLNVFIIGSKLGLHGHIRLRTTKGELPDVTFAGNARLDDFSTVDGVLGEDLLKWNSVRVSGIDARLNPPAVAVKEIAVDDASARVVVETNHTINLLAALRPGETNTPSSGPAVRSSGLSRPGPSEGGTPNLAAAGALPKISIATIVISNAQVRFTDRSLTPNVHLAIQQAGGTIAGLSSEELQHANVNLHAKVDNVGPVAITGTINPFSEHETNELNITVSNVDLTPTSPYAGKFAGYRIAKGKLNMKLTYHLYGRKLKAENRITLDQFTFGAKVNSPDATKLPVRLAVAILKDRSGKIDLDVPVEGNLDDPKFKLHKVIVHAIVNVLTKIVTSPFAALSAVFGGKGEEIRYQEFAPGSSELLAADKAKLDALAKGLYERPGLEVEIEGSVDPVADRDALRRLKLDRELRTARWQSLRKSARESITPDQITLPPDERADLLKQLYAEALAKGQIVPPSAAPRAGGEPAKAGAVWTAAPNPASATDKGATTLMQGSQSVLSVAVPESTGSTATGGHIDPTEAALLNSISIGENDFAELASERAKAVRTYLLQTGKVDPKRLFLAVAQPGGVKVQGSRVYLQLR